MAEPVRLGLIGAGRWGQVFISTLARSEEAVLFRVASSNSQTRKLVGPRVKVSKDWREVVTARDLDGVIIATPPAMHVELALAVVDSGLGVLVEKPLSLDRKEAQGLLDFAKRKKATVLVDHTHLYLPAYAVLKEEARKLGPVRAIRSIGGNAGPVRPDCPPLWDYGAHDLSLCLDLLGRKPVSYYAQSLNRSESSGGITENIRLNLEFPQSVKAEILIGNDMPQKTRSLRVDFDKQALVLDDVKKTLTRHDIIRAGQLGSGQAVPISPVLPLDRVIDAFSAALRSKSADLSSLRLGVDVVECLKRCEEALEHRP